MDLSNFSALLPEQWPAWMRGLSVLLIVGIMALLFWQWRVLRQRRAPSKSPVAGYDIRFDLFARIQPINGEQIGLLDYLQRAFAEEVVLYRPRLSHFLIPRKSRQRRVAQLRLMEEQVDFLVCDKNGKPLYAFDIDTPKAARDPVLKRVLSEKNLILKTASVRLVRLKGTYTHWPSPEVLRERMMSGRKSTAAAAAGAATASPTQEPTESGFAPSEFASSKFGQSTFGDSRYIPPSPDSTMGLNALMDVQQDENNAWANAQKR